MLPPDQEPVETKGGLHEDACFNHPAFGQISLHRIHGRKVLYGSDFEHNGFVRIEVKRSELRRGLSRDWPLAKEHLISIDLSEAQWASFVSSFGMGEGTQCTIHHERGKYAPGIPLRDSGQKYKVEADKKLDGCVRLMKATIAEVTAGLAGLSKARQEPILARLRRTLQELESNLPFIAEQFGEHMETRVEKAKVEVNAYMTQAIMRTGLDALRGQSPIGAIGAPSKPEGEP